MILYLDGSLNNRWTDLQDVSLSANKALLLWHQDEQGKVKSRNEPAHEIMALIT